MATIIDKITLELALELLNDNYVISKKTHMWDRKEHKSVLKQNVLQVVLIKNECHIYYFNGYGQKDNSKTIIVDPEKINEYLELYNPSSNDLADIEPKDVWTKHKKRVSKKSKDSSIVDEESSKILVYEWLLKKYKNDSDVIVPEVTLGDRRADYIAFRNKEICAIEIKSQVDTIERLEKQINRYTDFANVVYIAIHSNKIDSIEKLDIPEHVGIIEISKKLKVIKRAKKQKIDYNVFKGFISHQEYLDMKSGFKSSSIIEKKDAEIIFDKFLTLKQKRDFIFELIKNRFVKESKKRLEAYQASEFKKAVGSAKGIGVNRFAANNIHTMSLKQYFEFDKELISDYLAKLNDKVSKLYKNCAYLDLFLNDRLFWFKVYQNLQIEYSSERSAILELLTLINNSKILLNNKKYIQDFVDRNIEHCVSRVDALNSNEFLIIETNSKVSQNLVSSKLNNMKIEHSKLTIRPDFYRYMDADQFSNKKIIVTYNKTMKFYNTGKGIDKISLWRKEI